MIARIRDVVERSAWFLPAVMIVALLLRSGLLLTTRPDKELQKYEQVTLARSLAHEGRYAMSWPYPPADPARAELWSGPPPYRGAFMPPAIPFLYAGAITIAGDTPSTWLGIIIAQILLATALIPLLAALGTALHSSAAGRWAAVLSVFYIPSLQGAVVLSGAIFYQIALPVVLLLLMRAVQGGPSVARWALVGLTTGVLCLMRSEFAFIGPLVIACGALLTTGSIKQRVGTWLIAVVCAVAIVSPWTIRNTMTFDHVVPVSTHPWRETWRGFNDRASGSGYAADGVEIWESQARTPEIIAALDRVPVNDRFEIEADAIFRAEVLRYWSEQPLHSMQLIATKVLLFWTIDPYYPMPLRSVYIGVSGITALLLLLGVGVMLRHAARRRSYPLLVTAILYTVVVCATYVLPRYQAYTWTAMLPFGGIAVAIILKRFERA
jgi:4-amino-4-deoxy-L-arabinose transferase-like glycosyltransferase